jgi:hypothetical protein
MTTAPFGVPWVAWGGLCLAVAAVYTVVWPRPRGTGAGPARPEWRRLVLRWGHALVWLLLALSCFVRPSARLGGPAAGILAILALVAYAIFLGTLLIDRAARR